MHESAFRLHGTLRKTFFDRCGRTYTLNHVLRPELCKFFHSLCGKSQAPVVQTLDSAIHRINRYPADKYYGNQLRYPLESDLSGG